MAHIFPCKIVSKKRVYKVAYIYAVASLKCCMGMGIAKKLMKGIHEKLYAQGYEGVFLFPADESLFEYYDKLGYRQVGDVRMYHLEVKSSDLDAFVGANSKFEVLDFIKCEEVQDFSSLAGRLLRLKSEHYRTHNYESWKIASLCFALEDCGLEKGRILFFKYGTVEGFVLWKKVDDSIFVHEVAMDANAFETLYTDIMANIVKYDERIQAQHYKFEFKLPYWFKIGEKAHKAMIYPLRDMDELMEFMPNNLLSF